MNKLYNQDLSDIFTNYSIKPHGVYLKDENNYNFGWDYKNIDSKFEKVFYAVGCSWLHSNFFNRTFLNNYPEYMFINRAIGGLGNSMMIDILKRDIDFLQKTQKDFFILVCLTEVGRNKKDFYVVNPAKFSNSSDYFREIVNGQYHRIYDIVKEHEHHITTSMIPNTFNKNKSILDFCGDSDHQKPSVDVFNFSSGIHEYLKHADIFKHFDHVTDIKNTLSALEWLEGHQYVDETLHVSSYKTYELFLRQVI